LRSPGTLSLVIEEPCDTNSVPTRSASGLGPQVYLTSRPGARRPFPSLVAEKTRDAYLYVCMYVCTRVSHILGALCLYIAEEKEEEDFPEDIQPTVTFLLLAHPLLFFFLSKKRRKEETCSDRRTFRYYVRICPRQLMV
jgi:hypothetical protein